MKCLFFVLTLSYHFYNAIDAQFHPQSPCPSVFTYEGSEPEQDHWYGVILVSTDESLVGVRLDIRFDRPAELLVSWMGDVTSSDNERFTILSLTQKLLPGPPLSSRFMVKYNAKRGSPQLRSIRLNGRQICPPDPNFPIHTQSRPQITDSPTKRPDPAFGNSHSGGQYSQQVPSDSSGSIIFDDRTSTTTVRYSYNENSNEYKPSRKPPYSGSNNNEPEIIKDGNNVRPNKPVSSSNNGNYNSSPNNNYSNGKTESSNNNNNNNYETTPKYYKITRTSTTESYNYYEPVRPTQSSNNNDNNNHYNNNNNEQSGITKKPNVYNSNNHQSSSSSEEGSSNNNKNNHPKPSSSPVTGSGSNNGNSNNNNSKNTNQRITTTERSNTKKTTTQRTQTTKNTDCSGSYVNPVKNANSKCISLQNGRISTTTPRNLNEFSEEILGTSSSNSVECGLVDKSIAGTAAPAPLITNGQNTSRGQWPWHIALYKIEGIHLTYVCGGTLVTETAVITAAHCVTKKILDRPVDPDTLVVYLGKYHLYQFSDDGGVQNKQVKDVHVYPGYNSSNYLGDIAILILSSAVEYTPYVRPCCLWKFDQSVVDEEGTVVGWGFDENNKVTEELKMAKMPIVSQETCIWSYPDFFKQYTSDKTFCAGFRRGTTVCNGDSGGGMVFKQNSRWYLRGLVSITVAREGLRVCDTKHYVVFTDTAKYLEWINRYIT
ncbi:uncharacterized protein LOC142323596 [Lycorma delicatula]|uniref:uncharacterized protein LOC142323596 n=1 Tax=Lycorma delicatula TaxID=130591 RepID=UPI003F51278F